MRKTFIAICAVALFIAAAPKAEWPKTNAASTAKAWTDAFLKGDKEMRAFLEKNAADEADKEQKIEKRMTSYRGLKEHFKTLTLQSVIRSEEAEIEVALATDTGMVLGFTFEVDAKAPYRLRNVRIQHGHGE